MQEKTIKTYEFGDYVFDVIREKDVKTATGVTDMISIWCYGKNQATKFRVEYISAAVFKDDDAIKNYIEREYDVNKSIYEYYTKCAKYGMDLKWDEIVKKRLKEIDEEISRHFAHVKKIQQEKKRS